MPSAPSTQLLVHSSTSPPPHTQHSGSPAWKFHFPPFFSLHFSPFISDQTSDDGNTDKLMIVINKN